MPRNVIELRLPYPPSVNAYWEKVPRRARSGKWFVQVYLSKQAKQFHADVEAIIRRRWPTPRPTKRRVRVEIQLVKPDRRRRDCDNTQKATFDALTRSQFWVDDEQVDQLEVTKGPIQKPGWMNVRVIALD